MKPLSNAFLNAVQQLLDTSNPFNGKHKSKAERHKSGKTRRGATHRQGKHFLGRSIAAVSPAAFRQKHMGRTSRRWEKKDVRPNTSH